MLKFACLEARFPMDAVEAFESDQHGKREFVRLTLMLNPGCEGEHCALMIERSSGQSGLADDAWFEMLESESFDGLMGAALSHFECRSPGDPECSLLTALFLLGCPAFNRASVDAHLQRRSADSVNRIGVPLNTRPAAVRG